jgi:hypothetical protein
MVGGVDLLDRDTVGHDVAGKFPLVPKKARQQFFVGTASGRSEQ